MQSSLLLVVIAFTCATLAVELHAGPLRRRIGKTDFGRWHAAKGTRDDPPNCAINTNTPNVLYYEFPLTDTWAYAGLQTNANYFCIRDDEANGVRMALFKALRSFSCTLRPQNDTSCSPPSVNGCWFPDYTDCSDPSMRQQIIASGLCRSNGTPQQVIDGLMLTINRPNWLFIGDHIVSFDAFDFYVDDNFCAVWMTEIQMVIVSVRVDTS